MIEIDLKKLHEVHLELSQEVKRICEQNGIKYFLVAGTLLGAVRHSGFIPWDDDMDIGMLRSDYERFLVAFNNEKSNKYFLQTWDSDPEFALPIAKLRKNNTRLDEVNSSRVEMHKGIYIDIFPYDNIPDSKYASSRQMMTTFILKRIMLLRNGYDLYHNKNLISKTVLKTLKLLTGFSSKETIKKIFIKEMTRYNEIDSTERITIFGGAYSYHKESIKREWITELSRLSFEKIDFMVPKNSHEMLRSIYGDYMKIPPESERSNRHGVIDIDFGSDIHQ